VRVLMKTQGFLNVTPNRLADI